MLYLNTDESINSSVKLEIIAFNGNFCPRQQNSSSILPPNKKRNRNARKKWCQELWKEFIVTSCIFRSFSVRIACYASEYFADNWCFQILVDQSWTVTPFCNPLSTPTSSSYFHICVCCDTHVVSSISTHLWYCLFECRVICSFLASISWISGAHLVLIDEKCVSFISKWAAIKLEFIYDVFYFIWIASVIQFPNLNFHPRVALKSRSLMKNGRSFISKCAKIYTEFIYDYFLFECSFLPSINGT